MGICIVHDDTELKTYHNAASFTYIIQEFIRYPLEMSVLAYREPKSEEIQITSICLKEKLTLIGDGTSSIDDLAKQNHRARMQWPRLKRKYDIREVLQKDEKLVLEPIGNHSRGTTFLNGNHLNSRLFQQSISKLFNQIEGEVHFGRFDILYSSISEFIQLREFSIIEFNGVGSEPAHIYHPGFPLTNAYRELWKNIRLIGRLSKFQREKKIPSMTWRMFRSAIHVYRHNLKEVRLTMKQLNLS